MPLDALAAKAGKTWLRGLLPNGLRVGFDLTTGEKFWKDASGNTIIGVDDTHNQTIAGNKTFTGTVALTGANQVQVVSGTLTNAQIKALRATPITVIAAPSAGQIITVFKYNYLLKAGTNVLTESTANIDLRYVGKASGVLSTAEMTGFIDQAASTAIHGIVAQDKVISKANSDGLGVEMFNNGAGEFGGNAANDATLDYRIWYAVVTITW